MSIEFDVEETLLANDLPSDVIPHMLWKEFLVGTKKRTVFILPFTQTDILRGDMGTKISVPILSTRFSAGTISESDLDTSGYTVTDTATTDTDINISDQVYVAWRLSDILKEDQPRIDWVRAHMRDAGRAIAEYRDAALRDVLLAGAGNSVSADSAGTLVYDDVLDVQRLMKTDSWFPIGNYRPFLFIHPDQEYDLLLDTRYVNSHRYAIGELPDMPAADDMARGEVDSIFAGCRVRVSDNMTQALALVVFAEHPEYGPTGIHATKRPLTVRTDREELYGRQLWVASTRYGQSITQADGVGLISNC